MADNRRATDERCLPALSGIPPECLVIERHPHQGSHMTGGQLGQTPDHPIRLYGRRSPGGSLEGIDRFPQPAPDGLMTQPDAVGDLAQRQAAGRERHELRIGLPGPLWSRRASLLDLDRLHNGDRAWREQVNRQKVRVRIPSSPPQRAL